MAGAAILHLVVLAGRWDGSRLALQADHFVVDLVAVADFVVGPALFEILPAPVADFAC